MRQHYITTQLPNYTTIFFITGIHTDAGKTVVSAALQLALDADYWKPIQAGDLDFGDTDRVKAWTGAAAERFHPVRHELNTPASPHYAARLDGVDIQLSDFELPDTDGRPLIVEGAGGILVPINERETVADLMVHLGLPVILVSRHYLGSINHTLLSIAHLRGLGVEVAGVIYTGGGGEETVRIVERLTGVVPLWEVPELTAVDEGALRELVLAVGGRVREKLGVV